MKNEFIVHHDKLRDYGILTAGCPAVKEKLDQLELIKNEDYLLADVREQVESGGRPPKTYYLTPAAFKICLMRAQRRAN